MESPTNKITVVLIKLEVKSDHSIVVKANCVVMVSLEYCKVAMRAVNTLAQKIVALSKRF